MIARRLITALLMALFVSGIFTFWLSQKFAKPRVAPVARSQQYVATAQKMEAGDVLHPASLKFIEWPNSSPLEGAFVKPEEVNGRVLLYPLAANEPILERQLSSAGSGIGLATRIPDGMRAISLRSDQVVGVAGFLLPGTHVDVLVTYHIANQIEPVTSIVIQDAQILAAGQKTQPDPEGKASTVDVVTLLVNPEDAQKVVLASAQGTVHFVLRNGSDHEHVVDTSYPLSHPRAETVASGSKRVSLPVVPKSYTVQTINGDKQSTDTFQ